MRELKILIAIITSLLVFTTASHSLDFRGSIETDIRFAPEQEWEIVFTKFTLDTEITGQLSERLAILVEPRIVSFPIKKTVDLADLQTRSKADPVQLELGEAYGELRDFLIKKLDVKIGRQRVAWGVADKFNPTDNLNPDDLSDLLNFGEKIPSLGISALWYIADSSKIQVVWLPLFEPAALPLLTEELQQEMASQIDMTPHTGSEFLDSLLYDMLVSQGIDLTNINQKSKLPEPKLANSTVGVKVGTMLFDFDCSASYVYGFDDIGTPETIEISMLEGLTPKTTAFMGYHRLHVIGADLAGSLGWLNDLGIWAEAAYFIPERKKFKTLLYLPDYLLGIAEISGGQIEDGALVVTEQKIADEPYFKITAGSDYTFKNDIYINFQYVRGLPVENAPDLIGDYFVARAERSFMHEAIKATAFALWSSNDGSWGVGPGIEYYPVDNAELDVLYFYPIGSEDSKLKQLSDSLLIIDVKWSF